MDHYLIDLELPLFFTELVEINELINQYGDDNLKCYLPELQNTPKVLAIFFFDLLDLIDLIEQYGDKLKKYLPELHSIIKYHEN